MRGMKSGGYKTKGAATAALNKAAKKSELALAGANYFDKFRSVGSYDKAIKATLKRFPEFTRYNVPTNSFIANRDLIVKANYAIADATDFHNNIEKMVTRVNLMSKKEYEDRTNTPYFMRLDRETYWSR